MVKGVVCKTNVRRFESDPPLKKKNKKKLDTYCILFVYSVMNCDKCKKIKAVVKYKDGKYCTWYCAKKK